MENLMPVVGLFAVMMYNSLILALFMLALLTSVHQSSQIPFTCVLFCKIWNIFSDWIQSQADNISKPIRTFLLLSFIHIYFCLDFGRKMQLDCFKWFEWIWTSIYTIELFTQYFQETFELKTLKLRPIQIANKQSTREWYE